jgi:hypothetical protein
MKSCHALASCWTHSDLRFKGFILAVVIATSGQYAYSQTTHRSLEMIDSDQAAISRAANITGFKAGPKSSAAPATQPSRVVPYIDTPVAGWKVHLDLDGVAVKAGATTNPYARSFDVLLSKPGDFLRAVSNGPDKNTIDPFPAAPDYETSVSRTGQRYTALPAADPKIPMAAAIAKCAGSQTAKQLVVYYVIATGPLWSGPRPVWIVHSRATQPFSFPGVYSMIQGRTIPGPVFTNARTIVDALTGDVIMNDTVP